ncbi:hypothetical protein ACFRH5_18855, partial [Bacillus subtilis]
FLHLKPDEYLKKLYKTKKLVEKTSFSLQAEKPYWLLYLQYTLKFIQITSAHFVLLEKPLLKKR